MKYFNETLQNVASIKKEYRRLAHILHPDKGGNTEEMQLLNSEYLQALRNVDGTKYSDDGKEYVYKYDELKETAIINKIYELLEKQIDKIADIYLIGAWLWITNTNKQDREKFKECKLKWSNQRKAWYYHSGKYRHFGSKAGLASIAKHYGAGKVFRDDNQKVITI